MTGEGQAGVSRRFRPKPTIVSRKLQALRFIKQFYAEWGSSPSLEEIGAGLGVSRQRAHALVCKLAADRLIVRRPGNRGILLPDPALMMSRSDALLLLQAGGWKVTVDGANVGIPACDVWPLTESGLPLIAELDHIPAVEPGGFHDDPSGRG
ncbi:hypothetical protein [Sphingomonas sp. GM_Shp_2]|uniref:LexA family protein n=1 Tax=Sphingomonas sp. GM_Shp_2 TaxID=2937380 RepID=UPI00226AD96D|nr:hypothetical protein [Sphingomonas sp. GM_Shp_2]